MQRIKIKQMSLWRRTQEEFSYDFKKTILQLLEGKYRKPRKKLILDKINLTIESGEAIGIIGSNGSGKSTLLKIICGILQPTTGLVKTNGHIAPLIELGGGFDPSLSLVDNIIFYGVMLGFPRRVMIKRIPSILEFAELEEYAFAPVKSLSSGMKARLGFAIATDVQPDILLIDEVLSVGDAAFKKKSRKRIENFWQSNTTILVVSHDLKFIEQWCQRAIWLDKGRVKFTGNVKETIELYYQYIGA